MQRRASAPENEHERILAALRESPATKRAVLSSLLRAYDDAPSLLELDEHREVLQFAERRAFLLAFILNLSNILKNLEGGHADDFLAKHSLNNADCLGISYGVVEILTVLLMLYAYVCGRQVRAKSEPRHHPASDRFLPSCLLAHSRALHGLCARGRQLLDDADSDCDVFDAEARAEAMDAEAEDEEEGVEKDARRHGCVRAGHVGSP